MDKQKAGWSDWWHFFQILVNSEWIVIMLSDYSTYLIMSHHLTLIHTLQQLMNSTKLFLQSFNFSFASPEQNRCAIYLRFQKKILYVSRISGSAKVRGWKLFSSTCVQVIQLPICEPLHKSISN